MARRARFAEGLDGFEMIGMKMSGDDQPEVFHPVAIFFHLREQAVYEMLMAGVNEDGEIPADHITVAIVFLHRFPGVSVKIRVEFHKISIARRSRKRKNAQNALKGLKLKKI
jgi:hypothetical protein